MEGHLELLVLLDRPLNNAQCYNLRRRVAEAVPMQIMFDVSVLPPGIPVAAVEATFALGGLEAVRVLLEGA